jgi:hypothetical protein
LVIDSKSKANRVTPTHKGKRSEPVEKRGNAQKKKLALICPVGQERNEPIKELQK